jgi:hypothetical protein
MTHRRRSSRDETTRLMTFDLRPKIVCDDGEDDIFVCACPPESAIHSTNCPTRLKELTDEQNTKQDLMHFWNMGYENQDSVPYPTRAKGIAYYMGRHQRETYPKAAPRFALQSMPA